MNAPVRHLPWIGGAASVSADTKFSPLVSPIDESSSSQIVESDAAIIDAAVKHAYGAYMKHLDAPVAKYPTSTRVAPTPARSSASAPARLPGTKS